MTKIGIHIKPDNQDLDSLEQDFQRLIADYCGLPAEIILGKQHTHDMKPGKNILMPLCALCGATLRKDGDIWRCDHCNGRHIAAPTEVNP